MITAKLFYVDNPDLSAGMRRPSDKKATSDNKNPAGPLRNLTVNETAESKAMAAWLKQNKMKMSRIIERKVTVKWESKGSNIVSQVDVSPKP